MLKLRERLAWLILRSYSKHQVSVLYFFFFLHLFLQLVLQTRYWKFFRRMKISKVLDVFFFFYKKHLTVLIFQNRSICDEWKITENHRKSLFSLSFYHPSCLVIVFIMKNFSLFYPSRRTFEASFQANSIIVILQSRRRKTFPFYHLFDHCH